MNKTCRCFVALFVLFFWLPAICCEKYKLCVVDGKEGYKKSTRYCPQLDAAESTVECVVALDRMDCLRRINKHQADFAVFTPEDLVAASNLELEVLITNELRYEREKEFEYEVVAVVGNHANIRSRHDLRNKRFCHPGYGYETDWTRILSNYFEASTVPPQCDPQLTITENRVRASSEIFLSACKAGPWVRNAVLDRELKQKYPNLCRLCDNPARCSKQDKYWGRRGSLLCLTDGAGDISWARLDDVRQHFGLTSGGKEDSPEFYSLLCPDDSVMPLNSTDPCVWVVKPWSVIATRRTKAQEIQAIISSLNHSDVSPWKSSLLYLLETAYVTVQTLDPVESIESYFHKAKGFLSANSFSGCHPPRTIRICTTSNLENAKCAWLRESAAVYGVEPDLDCIKADNVTHCMLALNVNAADVAVVPPDLVHSGLRDFKLKTLFYETAKDEDKYVSVAVTRKGTKFDGFKDLRGAKACFATYDGVAWHSTIRTLQKLGLIGNCSVNEALAKYFGPSCVPGIPKNESLENLWKTCQDGFDGDLGALHCLSSGIGDVAFVSRNSIKAFVSGSGQSPDYPSSNESTDDFVVVCPSNHYPCHMSWAPLGQAMVRSNSTELWMKDTLDVFLLLDSLFGKNYRDLTPSFEMFGKYEWHSNVLFHDATLRLREVPTAKNTDQMALPYEELLRQAPVCRSGSERGVALLGAVMLCATLVFSF
ncbi:transferrin [Cylas formicarius]|uniref:transferrin n=1 Tax=Cylas formicarius TaxID=197179 RepID=UPI00295851D7|nr:transferrin [Cylas formicarius]